MDSIHVPAPNRDVTIVFNCEIHPYHIIMPLVREIQSNFVWYLRDSPFNGVIYVDFVRVETTIALGKTTSTWKYYTLAFGLIKKNWKMIDPGKTKQLIKLTPLNHENMVQNIQSLLELLEKMHLKKLNLAPKIPYLIRTFQDIPETVSELPTQTDDENQFIEKFRLHPNSRQASIKLTCSVNNLENELQRKLALNPHPKRNFLSRLFSRGALKT
ncbi:MAG: hypothetical protein ACYCQI_07815 [Gammaproteobacteria bacterium]